MKRESILKGCGLLAAAMSLTLLNSCSKEGQLKKSSQDDVAADINQSRAVQYGVPAQVYGVGTSVAGYNGPYLFSVDPNTGVESNPKKFVNGTNNANQVLGLAIYPNSNSALVTAVYPSSPGKTQFLTVSNVTAGAAGSNMPFGEAGVYTSPYGDYIKDIEANPTNGIVYGIMGDKLVRIDGLGYLPMGAGHDPAVVILGTLGAVGHGPYSISFHTNGSCAIMSAGDHFRAYINVPSTSSLAPITIQGGGAPYKALPATQDLAIITETASVIYDNGGTSPVQVVAEVGQASSTTPYQTSFYKWASNSSGVLYYQYISAHCIADYSAKYSNPYIIH